jgi:hypothetical protein
MLLYYCMLWRAYNTTPEVKFISARSEKELREDLAHSNYVAYSITDITNREVESFDL